MTHIIEPSEKDLGELSVRRIIPHFECRAIGPFVFFDHFGPAEFPPGQGIQVRPHPHIGLATVTYLYEGEIIHRDSLGYVQAIRPDAINLMTAGRGIVHSERAGDDLDEVSRLHGLQTWIALPEEDQERDPAFRHYPAEEIPRFEIDGVKLALMMGSAFGKTSPVTLYSETIYLDARIPAGSSFTIPGDWQELAVYVIDGAVSVNDKPCNAHSMAIAEENGALKLVAEKDCHAVVLGGKPLGKRIVWWNLVSTSRERIEQAKKDWKEGNFDSIPGETEFIPLPGD